MTKNLFGLFQYGFMRLYYPIVKYFLRLKVVGAENLRDVPAGAVFIANHLSKLDPFLIGAAVTRDYHKKIAAFRYPTFPTYMRQWYTPFIWLFGAYTIQPKSGELPKVLEQTIDILRAGQESVLIFPTGKIAPGAPAKEARPGIAYLARELDPVFVPVWHNNCEYCGLVDFLFRRRKVTIVIGRAFQLSDIGAGGDDLRAIAQKIMARVETLGH